MKKDALRGAEKYTKEHQRKKRWYRVVTCLACVVVFCTVYALILPAITLEKGACEIPEHTHSEACYTQVTSTRTEPVCTIENLNLHQHDDTCYDSEGNLTCGYADYVVHRHDSSCYDEDGNLWCPLPEIETHEHTDSCYAVPETGEPELICDKTEVILHEHTSDCFDEDGNLICGKIQVLEHQHTDACFETVEEPVDADTLTCTLPEDENHTHGPLCYGNWELTCGMEEHTHSEECQGTEEALEQGNLNMILPEGAQIPDGYDAHYSYIDPDNRFGVTVYASEGALPDNAVLSAELLEQGSEAYEAAQQALTDTVYDGFAALDIHFTVDGEEIEPESSVYVCINVMGLLPEDADADTLAVQHHEQTGAALLTPDEEESPAPAGAATVETVADATEETGQVEALDNGTETAADVAAAFEVESFSTFTITWTHNSSNYVLNLHYVDTEGNDIAPSGNNVINLETVNDTANVTMSNYADEIDHPGYVYQHAYINNGETKTAVNKLSYNTSMWYFTTKTEQEVWTPWTGSAGQTFRDVYLVYQEINTDGTVKVTWQNGAYTLYLHYVDTEGNPLQIDTSKTYVNSVAGDGNIRVSDYEGLVYPPASYNYQNAYIKVNNAQTKVVRISYNATLERWCITTPESDGRSNPWLSWSGDENVSYNETQAHVYLSYTKKTDAYYYAQPIHDNIKLTLYDYGSYINTGDDKVIPFYQASGGHSSIDGYQLVELIKKNRDWPPKMKPTLNDEGYPQVSSGRSLEYLFRKGGLPLNTGSATNPLTKYADMRTNATWSENKGYQTRFESMRFDLGNDGGLFHVDEDGYYIYDCENQSAYYNQDTNRFELSNTRINVGHNNSNYKNFLPFDKIDPSLDGSVLDQNNKIYKLPYSISTDKRSGIADLWFGMTMQVDFYMPSSGKVNGKDMVFDFRGDDDVWVYIDNVLVLDMGGCHAARNGSINFATGQVEYPNPKDNGGTKIKTTLKNLFTDAGVSTASFGNSNTFIDWTEHTLKFYYMERGGNISSCRLKFNLPTRPDKALQVAKTLTANEEADTDVVKHLENTMEYKYRVVKANADGNPTDELLIKKDDSYTITGTGLTANEPRTVGEGGYFTLKAGQMAEFPNMLARFDQNDSVKNYVVQEVMPTGLTGQYGEVVYSVGSDTGTIKAETTQVETNFTGYNSPARSAEVGNLVSYTNKVDTKQLSTLEITKTQVGSSLNGEPEYYYMKVQLGPDANSLAPISVGTTYYVGDDGTTRSVEQAGIIKLKAGETVKVKLLAGTHYKVEEVANGNGTPLAGNEGYTPTYLINNSKTELSNNASGTVTDVDTTVNITVTNTFPTGDLALTKIVNHTAGGSTDGEFEFELKFQVGENWKNTNYTAAYTTTNFGKTHTSNGNTLSFTKQDDCAVATVKLYHGEKVTVTGLPAGAKVSITENNSDGYSVGWNVDNQERYGKSVTCLIKDGNDSIATVTCTNTTGYELPDTGGTGTKPYTTGGFLLLTVAAILLLYIHTKHRKEGTISS
ncbi:MAG: fibro-slime domain-containing protein [Lachnospiraceae bacterium]|nr:fibro-slime domain-containing protein [Lachnospiraceae bacterium]